MKFHECAVGLLVWTQAAASHYAPRQLRPVIWQITKVNAHELKVDLELVGRDYDRCIKDFSIVSMFRPVPPSLLKEIFGIEDDPNGRPF